MNDTVGAEARALLLGAYQGVLSTHSQDMPGFPFGSVAPYCLDDDGLPLLLISDIAQHTKNLRADARCSFIVMQGGDDIQAGARLTLVGECRPVPAVRVEAAASRYYRYFPEARDFHRTHDFHFFSLAPARCRYIGGFGRIHWLAPETVHLANPFAGEREAGIVAHMNEDHADALRHYCAQAGMALPAEVVPVMAGIDAEGLHLRLGARIVRIPFAAPVATPLAARETLVAMARAGR
ncbi:MAG: HugZ family protein [Moraxellaceae bacterium]